MVSETIFAPTVCVCFDDQFAFHGTMAVLSAAWSLPKEINLRAYIVDTGVKEETAEMVRRILEEASVEYTWLAPDLEVLKRLPLPESTWLNHSTFARLLLPELLPAEVERFLYLDSDTIVLDDIRKLLTIDMEGAIVMACECGFYSPISKCASPDVHRMLGMNDCDKYFNAGILVFDCKAWRDNRTRTKTIDLILQYGSLFKHADQDALNITLRGKWKAIEQRWNVTSIFFDRSNGFFPKLTENPAIIHYTGPNPGTKNCFHPKRSVFYRIVWKSGWFVRAEYWKWILKLEPRIIVAIYCGPIKRVIKTLIGKF